MDFGHGEPEVVWVFGRVGADDLKGDLQLLQRCVETALGATELGDNSFVQWIGVVGF